MLFCFILHNMEKTQQTVATDIPLKERGCQSILLSSVSRVDSHTSHPSLQHRPLGGSALFP